MVAPATRWQQSRPCLHDRRIGGEHWLSLRKISLASWRIELNTLANYFSMNLSPLSRRTFLRGVGVTLALPLLEAMRVPVAAAAPNAQRRRLVAIMTPLGMHSENLFPTEKGRGYAASPYLKPIETLRDSFTVFSGLSHPEVDGGHDSERSFLTAMPHPSLPSFRNGVSLDQLAAERLGAETRFSSLQLSTMGGSLSWTRGGIQIPSEQSPARMFSKLFLAGSVKDVTQQVEKLRTGQSVMDTVTAEAKRFARDLSPRDLEKLDEYYTSVRELEQKLVKAEEWTKKPKPVVDAKPPVDIQDRADLIGRTKMMYDLVHLALQTDSTRLTTLQLQGTGLVVPLPGVTIDHHNLSHHGKDPEKLRQLALVEEAEMAALGEFLHKLEQTREEGGSLLEKTMVLFGSNLGNASSHDTHNMPMLLAGGGFKHGQHLAFDPQSPPPLCNLYLQMLHQLGVEVNAFGSSKGDIPGFEAA